jgi:hypothetical protein
MQNKIQGNTRPRKETFQEYADRITFENSQSPVKKPKHYDDKKVLPRYTDWDIIYKSMSPIERGQWNAEQRSKEKIKISGTTKPSSVGRVASSMENDKKYFDKLKEKGTIPLNLDFDKWLDEKEEFDLSSPELDAKKRNYQQMKLSQALQKIDTAMSGIMGALNLNSGGKVAKVKKDIPIKRINIADYFKLGMTVAELTPEEREMVSELVKKSLSKQSEH